jgi:two-component system cell cycle response regulator
MSYKILTVDDSKTIRMIVAKAFRSYDCTIFEADNGVTGLAVAAREEPDLIILDYTMPVMDGFETLSKLRRDPALKETPVMMLTAEAGRDTVMKMAKLSIRDYLIKPFKEEALIERVSKILQLRGKGEGPDRVRRYDDRIHILVVDDKPAIAEQVVAAVSDGPWRVTGVSDPVQAIDVCAKGGVDIVLASLSLPQDGAFILIHSLKNAVVTQAPPLLGLSVKIAISEQARAQQEGFVGCITKPIDPAELKLKISRTLRLETSYRYFQQRGPALCLKLPKEINRNIAHEVSSSLKQQLVATVDAGNDKLVIDLAEVEQASVELIELALGAIQCGKELSLRSAIIGSEGVRAECKKYEETKAWAFAANFDEALAMLA